MTSSGKKKTTMAKLARESRLRERRLDKQAKRDARKQAPAHHPDRPGDTRNATTGESARPGVAPAVVRRYAGPMTASGPQKPGKRDERFGVEMDPEDALLKAEPAPIDPRAKEAALRRLRDATDEELAVFEDKLRDDALQAGATEQQIRDAQARHPQH